MKRQLYYDTTITYGLDYKTLLEKLNAGTCSTKAVFRYNDTDMLKDVQGTFSYVDSSINLNAAILNESTVKIRFIPSDQNTYNTITFDLGVKLKKAGSDVISFKVPLNKYIFYGENPGAARYFSGENDIVYGYRQTTEKPWQSVSTSAPVKGEMTNQTKPNYSHGNYSMKYNFENMRAINGSTEAVLGDIDGYNTYINADNYYIIPNDTEHYKYIYSSGSSSADKDIVDDLKIYVFREKLYANEDPAVDNFYINSSLGELIASKPDSTSELIKTVHTNKTIDGSFEFIKAVKDDGSSIITDKNTKIPSGTYTLYYNFTPAEDTNYYEVYTGTITLTAKERPIVIRSVKRLLDNSKSSNINEFNFSDTIDATIEVLDAELLDKKGIEEVVGNFTFSYSSSNTNVAKADVDKGKFITGFDGAVIGTTNITAQAVSTTGVYNSGSIIMPIRVNATKVQKVNLTSAKSGDDNVELTAQVVNSGGAAASKYRWYKNGILVGTTSENTFIVSPDTATGPGKYQVSVYNSVGWSTANAPTESFGSIIITQPTMNDVVSRMDIKCGETRPASVDGTYEIYHAQEYGGESDILYAGDAESYVNVTAGRTIGTTTYYRFTGILPCPVKDKVISPKTVQIKECSTSTSVSNIKNVLVYSDKADLTV